MQILFHIPAVHAHTRFGLVESKTKGPRLFVCPTSYRKGLAEYLSCVLSGRVYSSGPAASVEGPGGGSTCRAATTTRCTTNGGVVGSPQPEEETFLIHW